ASGLAGLLDSESSQRERVVELQRRFLALKEETQADEAKARDKRHEQTELGEFLHQIELNKLEARAELERTFERLRTEYKMNPESWTPEALPEGFDADEKRKQLEDGRQRLGGMGAVNL